MKAIVLLSAGIDPVSGRPAPVGGEVRAIGLARALGAKTLIGLHAGASVPALADYGGYGLKEIICLSGGEHDPVAALAQFLIRASNVSAPDLVLAGTRGCGGADTGLLPYRLAEKLGWPIATGIAAPLEEQPAAGRLALAQARARGAVRPVHVTLPCVVTVSDMAECVPSFVFADKRAVQVRDERAERTPQGEMEEGLLRPYRRRPKLISAARTGGTGGQLLVDPTPEEAAAAIIAHLRSLGVLAAADEASSSKMT
ncbi:electron transfer flavoprotein subunit beta [Acetobacter estunensis NRIC 0472]|uniref:Electron transfer flavoprotein subunit beta n=1 Tax=Acetobacter estunensis TaxID=104097 RepID=A0A967B6B8_9PROT|nr:electron transfer flavoprotein subunit beta [Acetobacter estunensis]NHO54627.1 electron transfer flavoprotein subunit beta [Acetobacter estunensis]GBQ20492.1 electron transfer flavoprotein subunit beta [Acetobacter estunensis NRIC 0472]